MKIDVTKLAIVMDYLQRGGEVYYEGRTLVWLDNFVTSEDIHEGKVRQWGIDGLAIKGKCYKEGESPLDPDAGVDHYMGHDMPVSRLVQWTNNLSPVEFQRVARELTKLRSKE